MLQFLKSIILAQRELKTLQMCQFLGPSITVYSYAPKNSQIEKLLFHLHCNRNFIVSFYNGAQLLQLLFDNNQAKVLLPYEMSMTTAFEVKINFYAVALMSIEAERKTCHLKRDG